MENYSTFEIIYLVFAIIFCGWVIYRVVTDEIESSQEVKKTAPKKINTFKN